MNSLPPIFLLLCMLLINSNLACRFAVPQEIEGSCPEDSSKASLNCMDYGAVCAFFEGEQCDDGLCQKYVDANACIACQDPSVRSFRKEPCTGEKVFCDPEYRPEYCSDIHFNPVCAFSANCEGDDCRKNVRNPCNACQDPSVEYYIRGRCLDTSVEQKTHCDSDFQAETCSQTNEPVCAYQRDCSDKYLNPSCARTISNGCIACNDPSTEFYVPGECPGEKNFCDPDNRPNREETPINSCDPSVCIYKSDCEGESCTETDFLPVACASPNAEYYTLAPCP